MTKRHRRTNIPIHEAVIVWQPVNLEPRPFWVKPGSVAVFVKGDPRALMFLCSHGACWVDWPDQRKKELVRFLRKLKHEISRADGIPKWRIEAALEHIKEYRIFRVRQQRRREERWRKGRQQACRTR